MEIHLFPEEKKNIIFSQKEKEIILLRVTRNMRITQVSYWIFQLL